MTSCQKECSSQEELEKRQNASIDLFKNENATGFSGPANFNASLHCKDANLIRIKHNPGIWIIGSEQQRGSDDNSTRNNDGEEYRVELCNTSTISSFTNLLPGTFYRYKVHRVTIDGLVSDPEISPWFETFQVGHRSQEVKHIELTNQRSDDLDPSRVRADFILQPASDRSCHYDIVSFVEDQGLAIGNLDSSQDFHFSLNDIGYRTNVSVFVTSRNSANSENSNNVSLTFVTPSCLELHNNLTFCAPEKVKGFRVAEIYKNESNYGILVKWDEPAFLPDNYTLQFESLDYSGNEEVLPEFTSVLPGNATEAFITISSKNQRLHDDHQRVISIMAESPGGASSQTWIYVTLDETIDSSSLLGVTAATVAKAELQRVGMIAVPSIAIIAILLGGIVWFGRSRRKDCIESKRNRDDKRYKYCQSLKEQDIFGKKNNGSSTFYVLEKNLKVEFEKKDHAVGTMIDKFELRPSQLTIKQILGSGASGIVRLGSLLDSKKNMIDVAVKMLKDKPNTDDLKNFQQEIAIMKSAGQHQNIVSIIGCCTLDVSRPILVVEYCSRGDLQSYLRQIWQEMVSHDLERRARSKIEQNHLFENSNNNVQNITYWMETQRVAITNELYDIQEEDKQRETEEQITVTDLLSFARQVASGMEFLSSNRVIHRDLAARNVLLCADKTAKISDFGLSRDIYQENVYKKQGNSRLPLKWMAIEALTHQIYTTQSDVWSFGILLWEIVTLGCNPYPETPTNMILQLLKSGYRMEKPENCGNELYNIMLSCWRSRPQRRPNFTQLKHQLDGLLDTASENEYLNVYDLLRESTATSNHNHESMKLIEKNDYTNIYSK
ncbi:tyrosine-protein kinase receptor torso-like isoform X2 [Venturia canescens]|uniref:tyrosine-protein kinase receptor torso-like isoform X2 n=1 Tax=Venturia canescens TaxID=32260 RepID=UPI001C9BE6BB|nr:tyrosine-protein kinase receptor torso-like isoform X2 [Venturia canescens]